MFNKLKEEINQFFDLVAKKDQEGVPDERWKNPDYLKTPKPQGNANNHKK